MPLPAKIHPHLVRALFDYDYLSGALTPKPTAVRAARRTDKYQWEIDGRRYSTHRLIWAWHNPQAPNPYVVSFIDGDKTNTRIENLKALHEHPRWVGHVKQVRMKMDKYGNLIDPKNPQATAPQPDPNQIAEAKIRASKLRLLKHLNKTPKLDNFEEEVMQGLNFKQPARNNTD